MRQNGAMERPLLPGYYLRFSIFRWLGWQIGKVTGSAARGLEDGYRSSAGTNICRGVLSRLFVAGGMILLVAIFVAFLSPSHATLCLVSLAILVIIFRVRMPGSVRALLYFVAGAQVVWGLLIVAHRFTGDAHPRLEFGTMVALPVLFALGLIPAARNRPVKPKR